MTEIPDPVLARFVIDASREWGEYEYDGASSIALGEYGQYEAELDYSLTDLDPSECEVEYVSDYYVRVRGTVEGAYQEKVLSATYNPPGQAHPAEYETHYVPVAIDMTMDLTNLAMVTIESELL